MQIDQAPIFIFMPPTASKFVIALPQQRVASTTRQRPHCEGWLSGLHTGLALEISNLYASLTFMPQIEGAGPFMGVHKGVGRTDYINLFKSNLLFSPFELVVAAGIDLQI
eukprot:379669-Pelagomonas_calceolata.AAC.5